MYTKLTGKQIRRVYRATSDMQARALHRYKLICVRKK